MYLATASTQWVDQLLAAGIAVPDAYEDTSVSGVIGSELEFLFGLDADITIALLQHGVDGLEHLEAHRALARLTGRDLTTVAFTAQALRIRSGSLTQEPDAQVHACVWHDTNPVDQQIAPGANRLRWDLDLLGVDVWNRDWDSPPTA